MKKKHWLVRLLKKVVLLLSGLILLVLFVSFAPYLWNRLVAYPRFEKQVREFKQLRQEVPALTNLKTFEGHIHMHSFWSHDSEGQLSEIIPAAKNNNVDFIFLSDHPRGNEDVFPRGFKGLYEGVLIEPGSEKKGLNVWPLDTVMVNWAQEADSVVKTIVNMGGLVIYSHTEEEHNWENPWYQGMEIYNFHTDVKDEKYAKIILNFLVNGSKYRHWAYRENFDEQVSILARWDQLNKSRKIVGFAAIDTHENQNFRARYLPDGRVEWMGPNANVIDTMEVKFWNRWLFSDPDPGGWIFKWMVDTYETGFNYVANYVFADTLSAASLARHMKLGHVYVAFKDLGDGRGFMFHAQNTNGEVSGIMGDSISADNVKSLHARSPLPGEFRLVKDGKIIDVLPGANYSYQWAGKPERGAYRVEVHVQPGKDLLPWIYSNSVYIY